MTKLFTAAEARRIDIERGGEGIVSYRGSDACYYHFDEVFLLWRNDGNDIVAMDYSDESFVPLTPEPEQEDPPLVRFSEWQKLTNERDNLSFEKKQLEKELAESGKQINNLLEKYTIRGFDIVNLKKKLAEYTNGIHATSVIHDEFRIHTLEKELAEANEKERKKSCQDDTPEDGALVYFDKDDFIGHGFYQGGCFYMRTANHSSIKICPEQIARFNWKYEADL